MKDKNLIYGLYDPRDGELRYIGKSSSGLTRPKHHLTPSIRKMLPHLPVYRWIEFLAQRNLTPEIDIIEDDIDDEKLSATEFLYICQEKHSGTRLLNCTLGGEGSTGRKVSQKTKDLMRLRRLGHKLSEETKKKISLAHLGRKISEESKIKARLNNPIRKPIICLQTNQKYNSIREAAKDLNIEAKNIRRVLSGQCKLYKGRSWTYL